MAKVNLFPESIVRNNFPKLLRLMKTFVLLLVICFAAGARSQSISLNMKQSTLVEVFNQVQKLTGKSFVYKWETIKDAKPVSINVTDASLEEVLNICLKHENLNYTIVDDVVVISKKTQEAPATIPDPLREIKGKITNEQGQPVSGVTITIKGTKQFTTTNEAGEFKIEAGEDVVLVISHVSFETKELRVKEGNEVGVQLKRKVAEVEGVSVSTGYQRISKERFVGSFSQLDSAAYERRAGMGILDRLDGTVTGVLFDKKTAGGVTNLANMQIRGLSTLNSPRAPLVIVDDFPFTQDLSEINPNDVETITVLKDAAAMSIWGARAGNGVIVITTKKGKYNQPIRISISSDITINSKRDLYYYPQMNISDFIDVEEFLFNKGFYDANLSNTITWPIVSPIVEMLAKRRAGKISWADSTTQITAFKELDLRQDLDRYVYRNASLQRYYANMAGGTSTINYSFSAGYNISLNEYQNSDPGKQVTLSSSFAVRPFKKLQILSNIGYTRETNKSSIFSLPSVIYPYAQLADVEGNPLAIPESRRLSYIDTAGGGALLDWRYRPLEELKLADATLTRQLIQANFKAIYQINSWLTAEASYQYMNEFAQTDNYHSLQTYYTRSLINQFTNLSQTIPHLRNPVPVGGILNMTNASQQNQNARARLDINKRFAGMHQVAAMLAAEVSELVSKRTADRFYNYNKEYGSYQSTMDFLNLYPEYVFGSSTIPSGSSYLPVKYTRFVSLSSNVSYTYKSRYTVYLSVRKDGSNLFGVNTNKKWTPLWSSGFSWDLSKESFYNSNWMPYLRIRASYGYAGNPGTATGLPTIDYAQTPAFLTNLPYATTRDAPNPNLKWEKVGIINAAVDFSLFDNRISGSVDIWNKKSTDLIASIPFAPATGIISFTTNTASLKGKGVDINIKSKNIAGAFSWETNFGFSRAKTIVTKLNAQSPLYKASDFITYAINATVGQVVYGMSSYRWAGLDATGNPQGYLNKQISTDYPSIFSDSAKNQVFHGSSIPLTFGFIGNSFTWKNFTLSANITYRFDFYFRKPTINYGLLINSWRGHPDYALRWQKPGDERFTNIPSFVYPVNSSRDGFFQNSEINVLRGDNIRLQDIRLQYNCNVKKWKKKPFENLTLFVYGNNLNVILWRKNISNIDPDYIGPSSITSAPDPRVWTGGIRLTL